MNTTTFVIDASTTLKWIFNDEVNSHEALELQEAFLAGNVSLLAPSLWYYEITNGIKSAVLRERISDRKARRLLGLLMQCQPTIVSMKDVFEECLANAIRFQISVYDSSYLTLALTNKIPFITADGKLASKINSIENGAAIPISLFRQFLSVHEES